MGIKTITRAKPQYDFIIIGSGCGGSISALRLTEKGEEIVPGHFVKSVKPAGASDGSAISANPGINPSLSISAMTERAMAKIPLKIEKLNF